MAKAKLEQTAFEATSIANVVFAEDQAAMVFVDGDGREMVVVMPDVCALSAAASLLRAPATAQGAALSINQIAVGHDPISGHIFLTLHTPDGGRLNLHLDGLAADQLFALKRPGGARRITAN